MNMDKNEIKLREDENDGRSVFLYYDNMAGVYLAFGLSAYYTTMVTDPFMSYSEEMQMPVAILRREHILYLRESLEKIEHTSNAFYRFELRIKVGDAGYDRWAEKIHKKHQHIPYQ